ncbi:MAG: hypothetical protein Q9159_006046 [Coniocarpon cinnabarinum]
MTREPAPKSSWKRANTGDTSLGINKMKEGDDIDASWQRLRITINLCLPQRNKNLTPQASSENQPSTIRSSSLVDATSMSNNNVVVFSGGSAANSLTDVFDHLMQTKQCGLSYVIPISDNGGSTSELIRVFGGPGMFDDL